MVNKQYDVSNDVSDEIMCCLFECVSFKLVGAMESRNYISWSVKAGMMVWTPL